MHHLVPPFLHKGDKILVSMFVFYVLCFCFVFSHLFVSSNLCTTWFHLYCTKVTKSMIFLCFQSFSLLEIMQYLVLLILHSGNKIIFVLVLLHHSTSPVHAHVLSYATCAISDSAIPSPKDVIVFFCLCVCSTIPHLCTQVPHKLTNMLLMITWCLVQKLYPWLPQLPGEPGGGWKAARHLHLDLSHLPGWLLSPDMATPPDQPADNSWAQIRKHLDRTSETFKEKRSPCCLLVFLRPFWLPQSIVLQWVRRSCDGRSTHKANTIVRE